MDLTTSQTSATSAALAGAARQEGGAPALSSDFETFLKMLTVQMENQDPLNPVDSADYAVQLATFSGVEQQVLTNDLLRSLAGALGTTGLGQVAGWVGREARVTAPVAYEGAPVTVVARIAPGADSAMLIVRNAAGTEVDRAELPQGGGAVDWVPADPAAAGAGPLTFHVESRSAGAPVGEAQAAVYAPVREVRIDDGAPVVVLPGGASVAAAKVTALREP